MTAETLVCHIEGLSHTSTKTKTKHRPNKKMVFRKARKGPNNTKISQEKKSMTLRIDKGTRSRPWLYFIGQVGVTGRGILL